MLLEVVNVHVRGKFHQAECMSYRVDRATMRKTMLPTLSRAVKTQLNNVIAAH